MMKMNHLGAFRSLNTRYGEHRKEFKTQSYTPRKQSLNDSGSCLNETGKTTLLQNNQSYPQGPVELQHWNLPPKYMELFDNTSDMFKEIQLKYTRLQEEQQKRITPRFNEDENTKLDKIIRELVYDLTKNIRKCEDNIKEITYINVDKHNDKLVKDNMRLYLASKLQEYTKNLRNNEENYIKKYQELGGDMSKFSTNKYQYAGTGPSDSNANDPQFFLQIENNNDLLKKRDSEINNLVTSINELSTIFKDLQMLVFEQGTILDRIDYNIEKAVEHHKDANKDLKISEETLKNNCARNSVIFLIILIFVLAILLIIKFTS